MTDNLEDNVSSQENAPRHADSEKCTHLLPKSPKHILACKSCFKEMCQKCEQTADGFAYVFVPYKNKPDKTSLAYLEVDMEYLDYALKETKNKVIDLVTNFRVLHIEPNAEIHSRRKEEIRDFFHSCRKNINYPQMGVA